MDKPATRNATSAVGRVSGPETAALTFAFPAKVISGVLGLPEADYQQFQEWAVGIIAVYRDWDRAILCSHELREYLSHIVAARRTDPRDELLLGKENVIPNR